MTVEMVNISQEGNYQMTMTQNSYHRDEVHMRGTRSPDDDLMRRSLEARIVALYEGRGGQRKVAQGDLGTINRYFGDLETRSPNNGEDY